MRHLPCWMAASLLCVTACEPATGVPTPVMAMVIGLNGQYEPRRVDLATVTDVVALEGAAARLVGGARIVIDFNDPLLPGVETEDQLADLFVKTDGAAPRASYVEQAGVLWPADFHSWNMVSTYYNFERAFAYFQANGVSAAETIDPATQAGATVYYFPEFVLAGVSAQPMQDNALFSSLVRGFGVLPFKDLQQVPLSMNSGVVTHEFAHRVFNLRVYGGASIPTPFSRWVSGVNATPPLNILKALDEGLADFHAVGASCATSYGCDTRFLSHSMGEGAADARDLAPSRCLDAPLWNSINTLQISAFQSQGLDYRLGTVLAHTLYKASYPFKREVMEQALLAAYDDPDPSKPGLRQLIESNAETPGNFTLGAVAKTILQHINDPSMKVDTCNAFLDHLQIPREEMTASGVGEAIACPAAAANPGTCPSIN